jgi:hypothetical protein
MVYLASTPPLTGEVSRKDGGVLKQGRRGRPRLYIHAATPTYHTLSATPHTRETWQAASLQPCGHTSRSPPAATPCGLKARFFGRRPMPEGLITQPTAERTKFATRWVARASTHIHSTLKGQCIDKQANDKKSGRSVPAVPALFPRIICVFNISYIIYQSQIEIHISRADRKSVV